MKHFDEIMTHLNKNKLDNINLVNFMENNTITGIEKINNSWIVRGTSDRNWVYISCSPENELQLIKNALTSEDKNFAAIDDWMKPVLTEGKSLKWDLPFRQYYLPDNVILPESAHHTQPLSAEDAVTIYENSDYQEFSSIEYTTERIQKGASRGIFIESKLVAWGLTQDDGAMGFLHVLDNARKQGYGSSVTMALIADIRTTGKIPFCYIKKDNEKSINLVTKLEFIPHKSVHWFEVV